MFWQCFWHLAVSLYIYLVICSKKARPYDHHSIVLFDHANSAESRVSSLYFSVIVYKIQTQLCSRLFEGCDAAAHSYLWREHHIGWTILSLEFIFRCKALGVVLKAYLKQMLKLLFSRAEYSQCIMDRHLIIDVSYRCGVFWSFCWFFFLQRLSETSFVTVMVMVVDFYLSVYEI